MGSLEFPFEYVNNSDRDGLVEWLAKKQVYPKERPYKEGFTLYRAGEEKPMGGKKTHIGKRF